MRWIVFIGRSICLDPASPLIRKTPKLRATTTCFSVVGSATLLLLLPPPATKLNHPFLIFAFWPRVLLALLACAAAARAGVGQPIAHTFGPRETGSSGFYWCTAQDERGVLYFGTDALLTFDGDRWTQHPVPGAHALRGVALDPAGRVWIGAFNEIGYFDRLPTGGLSPYRSLLPQLPATTPPLGNVWHTFVNDGLAVFVTADRVLVWDGNEFTVNLLPGTRRLPAMQADGRVFVSHLTEGLFVLEGTRLRPFTDAAARDDRGVAWMKKDRDRWLMVTTRGLAAFDGKRLAPLGEESGEFIARNVLSCATSFSNGDLCVGTLNGGLAVLAPDGTVKNIFTSADGLRATSVMSVFVDRDDAVWITSSMGVTRIDLTSGVTSFGPPQGLAGKPARSIAALGQSVLVATEDGVFALPLETGSRGEFRPLPELPSRYSDLVGRGDTLAALGYKTLTFLRQGRPPATLAVEDFQLLRPSRAGPDAYLTTEGFRLARLVEEAPGNIRRIDLGDTPDQPTEIVEDDAGDLWFGTQTRGAFQLDRSGGPARPLLTAAGQPLAGRTLVARVGDAVAVCSETGVQLHRGSPRPFHVVEHAPASGVLAISNPDATGGVWIAFKSPFKDGPRTPILGRLSPQPDGAHWQHYALSGLGVFGEINALTVDGRGVLWVGENDGVLRIEPARLRPVAPPRQPTLRASVAPGSQVAAHGEPVDLELGAVEFGRRDSLRFQTRLTGHAAWSAPTNTHQLTFAGLRDGHYEFAVRVINDAGLTSPAATWRFTVLPPWYRTKTALAAWIFLIAAGCFGIIQWRSAYLSRRNLLLEELVRRKTDQLEKANAAKSDFLANMSHEIRNPISGIVGLSLAMEETALDPRQRHLTDSIRSCASLLATLVDDVLDFSKIEAGRIDLRPAPFELRAALEQCAAMVAEDIRRHGGRLTLELAPALPTQVVGDAGRIQQIVLNYLTNAVKFGGGQPIVVGALPRGPDRVRLFVRDQGPGMSEAEAAALFTKFTRLPDAQSKNIRGSGLGLAVCRLLATKMGGAVGVDSRPGAGSTFWADLPLPAAHAPRPATVAPAPSTPLRALIVEDIDYNATAMQAVLRKLGIESEVASDGPTAFEKLQSTFYDVAFMDWNLPGMIGTEVVSRYRRVEPASRRTIIIATTAYSADFNREACLAAGMDAFIAKPFTPEKIGAALADLRGSLRAAASVSVRAPAPPPAAAAAEFDLQMLRFLADETPDGLRGEIARYLAAVDTDRQAAHAILPTGNAREIHRIAHRLVSHASAINYEPLVRLARELQAHAATDDPARLHRVLAAFDAEFAALRKKLDSIPASTAPA